MRVRDAAEQRLGHRLAAEVVEEPEVGVVRNNHELGAALRLRDQRARNRVALRRRRHVAGRVVGEVQHHQQLLAALGVLRERLGEARGVEAAACVERERHDFCAEANFVGEPVVAPQLIGQQDQIAGRDEQVAHQREAVGERARNNRQAHGLAALRGVLRELLLTPALAQRGLARSRRVVVRLLGRDP